MGDWTHADIAKYRHQVKTDKKIVEDTLRIDVWSHTEVIATGKFTSVSVADKNTINVIVF